MTTFERYFIADKATHNENPNPYYQLRHNEKFVRKLLGAFGLDPDTSHVVNGHTPVKRELRLSWQIRRWWSLMVAFHDHIRR
ncbi:fructose-1,6-bisphosphatase (plasmid) [Companilactobacillus futsaii]|uniref:Fructose-1,6-bisphosphatase n=1 Tax=Companilactobacillus futsaii TaxID=938155 RepID=A0A5B7T6N1_9LACO|nr:fructose-1,6-bisphosphatase [Companilactobacillus futsaii]